MQNSPQLKKWADITGMPVVTIDTGKSAGTVDDFYFEPEPHAVYALQVKTGVFGHRALISTAIKAIGQDAITVTDESMLVPEKNDERLATMPLGHSLLGYKILSESGAFIGTVGDIIFDTSTPNGLRIDSYELKGGIRERWSGDYSSIRVEHVVRYGEDVIIVTDEVAKAFTKH